MTYTPTNRPVPSDDPEVLLFNSRKLDEYVNSSEDTMLDRNAIERLTLHGITGLAGDVVESAEEAAASAASAAASAAAASAAADVAVLNAAIYPTTAAGLAATTNGQYFSVVSPNPQFYLDLYRNVSGAATLQKSYPSAAIDALTVNSGKAFPLKQMTRGGVTSPANATVNSLVLGVKVIGDAQYLSGKFYQIAYFQNEANVGGNVAQGIILLEFDAATFAATGTPTVIHTFTNAPADIVRTGGVQTFTIVPEQRKNLLFVVTIDAAALPPAGTAINMQVSGSAGYSWIIEQSSYTNIRGIGNTIEVNRYRVYPQKLSARNNVTSVPPLAFMAALLDIQVLGARAGKLYRVAYFKNGSAALPGPADGWIFEEFDAAGYETASNPATVVVNYTDAGTPAIPRSGIQTVVLKSTVVSGLSFRVTLDTALLPAYGTLINGNNPGQAGYSYIIDPQRYVEALGSAPVAVTGLPLQWSMGANLLVAWASKTRSYRLTIGPNGVNQLPNIIRVEGAAGVDLAAASWVELSFTNSDWFPPMQVSADSEPQTTVNFTGGAHGSTGGADGDPTARCVLFQCFADKTPLVSGASGGAERIRIQIINEVMGYNTVTLGRYIVRQALNVNISAGCLELEGCVTPLENVTTRRDYGLQLISGGFQGTQLVLGGSNTARGPFLLANNDSGPKSAYPNAWAVVLQEPTNGQMALWMDTSYEVGDGRHVVATEPLLRGSTFGKWYLGPVLSPTVGVPFATGTGYKYRAGLSWQSPGMQPTGLDSAIEMSKASHPTFAYGLPNADFVKVS